MKNENFSSDLPFRAYNGEESYIFVSYAHIDKDIVYPEMLWVKQKGYRIWYDEGIPPTSEWPAEIEKALLNCKLLLVFITPNAIERRMVRDEINYALDHDKIFLAVFLEPTDLKYGLNLRMSNLQHIKKYELQEKDYQDKVLKSLKSVERFSLNDRLQAIFTVTINFSEIIDYCRLRWKASRINLKLYNTRKYLLDFFIEFTRIIPEIDKWFNKLKLNYESNDNINENDADELLEEIDLIYEVIPFFLKYKKPEERNTEIDEKLYAMCMITKNFVEISDYCMLRWRASNIAKQLDSAKNKLSQFFKEFDFESIVRKIDKWIKKLKLNYISEDNIDDEDADVLANDIEKFKKLIISSLKNE